MHFSKFASPSSRGHIVASPDCRWYVVEIQREKAEIAQINLRAQGFETFHPEMRVSVNQFGKPAKRLRPVFPGYCFVRCSISSGRWRAINSTRGVKRFAGPPGVLPVPVRDSVVDTLIARCPNGILDPSAVGITIGQQVRLSDCAFEGALATVHELDDLGRVKVLIALLGSDRIVSVPKSSVAPANLPI